ncbi:hypothetical protein Ait01nite_041500 [Actinoplanes italicus]|uniref:Uncharacterized protein n=1 Tax=Actinoplanes italicus TaxID=113567 RepID=A0A2T0K1V2_9ACTN|nr:hypothetical protein [Actinoplanes italicus]PRX16764.1 hypothetical protein CLV67_11895 [Actinoplanes italicus]GIE31105.1 hypothetical protein Ait01nite_041500 [Actinoplanes italicus]
MGGFILGVAIALFVGMRLARHIDGRKGALAGYKKANTDLPGLRSKMRSTRFGLFRFVAVLVLIVIAAAWMWMRADSGGN